MVSCVRGSQFVEKGDIQSHYDGCQDDHTPKVRGERLGKFKQVPRLISRFLVTPHIKYNKNTILKAGADTGFEVRGYASYASYTCIQVEVKIIR